MNVFFPQSCDFEDTKEREEEEEEMVLLPFFLFLFFDFEMISLLGEKIGREK